MVMWKSSRILKGIFVFLAVILLLSPPLSAKRASFEQYLQELHAAGKERVIVKFNNQPDKSTIAKYNAKLIRELKIINALVCEIDQTAIEKLRQQSNIKYVSPDTLIGIPQSTRIKVKQQTFATLLYQGSAPIRWENLATGLNAKSAWDNYGLGGNTVKIAFLDTGINYGADPLWPMPNLSANYIGGYDFIDDDSNPMPYIHPTNWELTEYHGTMMASNCLGTGISIVVGTAYNTSYYSLRILSGPDATGPLSNAIAALEWCLDPDGNPNTTDDRPDIINMSFGTYDGGGPFWPYDKADLEAACNAAYEAGIILLAASGNDGYSYSAWPASFANVISVGGHAEDQTLYSYEGGSSNGGADIISSGAKICTVSPENYWFWVWGTSTSAAHVSGLIALQLQYARQNNVQPNNGYLWEVMKHAAHHLTGQAYDPVYQGSGKVYAAQTDANDANIGSIDLMAANWPISYDFNFSDYAFTEPNYPIYLTGTDINQTITLTNLTDVLGNAVETIENLVVTATYIYCDEPNEPNLAGDSNITFPVITLLEPNEVNSITLNWVYALPANAAPGLVKTKLALEFNFAGNTRIIKIIFSEPNSFWYAAIPADLDLSNTVDFLDFSEFSTYWQQTDCSESNNWCNGADINHSSAIDLSDLSILAENWLRGL